MEKEGIIGRIKILMDRDADNANSFSKKVGIDPSGFRKKMKGETAITPKDVVKICEALQVNRDWLENGNTSVYTEEGAAAYTRKIVYASMKKRIEERKEKETKVPFYDVEFALGYDEMYNDTPNVPTKFISIPGYEKADFWCRASGDSMKPVISNGDIIALKAVEDWQSFLPMNEVYAIMTTNDLRTVKVVRRGSDDAHFTLHAYNEEYEDQEIPKTAITKVFKVLGSLKAI